jgi:hypothetical protein
LLVFYCFMCYEKTTISLFAWRDGKHVKSQSVRVPGEIRNGYLPNWRQKRKRLSQRRHFHLYQLLPVKQQCIISTICSRTDSRVKMLRFSDVSVTNTFPIFRVLLMAWFYLHILTRLSARGHFMEFCRRNSSRTYIISNVLFQQNHGTWPTPGEANIFETRSRKWRGI